MNRDIARWSRECVPCQRSKTSRHVHLQPAVFDLPDERFDHVHIDIVGPLPPCDGFRYLLTMIDRFSRWPEAVPLKDITADNVATNFYNNWVSRFGSPKSITTDQGTQFEHSMFAALAELLGSKKLRTTAYHPASNGMIERWHRSIKAAIKCHETTDWVKRLPSILLGLRTSYKEDIQGSAAEYLYGTSLRIPGEFFTPEHSPTDHRAFFEPFRSYIAKMKPSPASNHDKRKPFCFKNLSESTHVMLRQDGKSGSLVQPYSGPHKVLDRPNDRLFTLDINGRRVNVNVERLKPAYYPPQELLPPAQPTPTQVSMPPSDHSYHRPAPVHFRAD